MRRRGFTLVELLIAVAVSTVLLAVAYAVFHLLFTDKSRFSVTSLTRRSFVQKDARSGLRRLVYRVREAIQILEPLPGRSGSVLVFRDILNQKIRIRLESSTNRLISEKESGGSWAIETNPTMVDTGGGSMPASWPISMQNCTSVHFTALSPECVSIRSSIMFEEQNGTYMTIVKLRNASLSL